MGMLDLAGSLVQLAGSVDLPLAHPTDFPHEEVDPKQGGGGGTNPVLVGAAMARAGHFFPAACTAESAIE
jgi:hypothetical protein